MNAPTHIQRSATVLAFPKGGRSALTRRDGAARLIPNDNQPPQQIVVTDAWYHQAAMAEDSGKKS